MAAAFFLFPGQGSQVVGMGKEFFEASERVRALYAEASEVAGIDLAKLCFEGPIEELTETRNLQPAMATTVLACYSMITDMNLEPSYVAGHSLGEYAALTAAGVISTSDCIRLTSARGRLMQEQAEAHPGAMGAVLKLEADVVEKIVTEIAAEGELICLANYNAPTQLVVSGSEAAIEALIPKVKEVRGRVSRLRVSGAWHSPLMKEAEAPFAALIEETAFADAKAPVMLNVTGEPATDGTFIKSRMKEQMCSGVRWYPGILRAWNEGIRDFVEFGPKSVLSKMLKTIVPDINEAKVSKIENREDIKVFSGIADS